MRSYLDCIPCFLRQTVEAARMATDDGSVHEQVLREVLERVQDLDMSQSPPAMGQIIHRRVRTLTGNADPYRQIKDAFNRVAMDLYPDLKTRVEASPNPLGTAVRLSIAGNIIDCGVHGHLDEAHVLQTLEEALDEPLAGDIAGLGEKISSARSILYLADNAGEIVLDRILIEQMPPEKVTVVVRGSPIINDATMDDARAVGLTELVNVVDNGSDAPGTLLEDCSGPFRSLFDRADLVLAKGQGNSETLSDADKNIVFMLKAKCPVVARDIGCAVGERVLRAKVPSG